jgi:hypothetical protein
MAATTIDWRLRTCRNSDRQCRDTRGKEHPGHRNISFKANKRAARLRVPPSGGLTKQPSAPV